ncbi:MAG: nucleotidyltransferase family protein [Bacteroidales bacterium]|nr:nucleotidyltransferase family protein [Bacteroidales bacterium]
MDTLNDIRTAIIRNKQRLLADYPIKSLAIFGSFARNDNQDKSDVDIIVEFNGKIGIRFIDLADDLEKILGRKIDLVSRNGIKEKYFQSIINDLIYV